MFSPDTPPRGQSNWYMYAGRLLRYEPGSNGTSPACTERAASTPKGAAAPKAARSRPRPRPLSQALSAKALAAKAAAEVTAEAGPGTGTGTGTGPGTGTGTGRPHPAAGWSFKRLEQSSRATELGAAARRGEAAPAAPSAPAPAAPRAAPPTPPPGVISRAARVSMEDHVDDLAPGHEALQLLRRDSRVELERQLKLEAMLEALDTMDDVATESGWSALSR